MDSRPGGRPRPDPDGAAVRGRPGDDGCAHRAVLAGQPAVHAGQLREGHLLAGRHGAHPGHGLRPVARDPVHRDERGHPQPDVRQRGRGQRGTQLLAACQRADQLPPVRQRRPAGGDVPDAVELLRRLQPRHEHLAAARVGAVHDGRDRRHRRQRRARRRHVRGRQRRLRRTQAQSRLAFVSAVVPGQRGRDRGAGDGPQLGPRAHQQQQRPHVPVRHGRRGVPQPVHGDQPRDGQRRHPVRLHPRAVLRGGAAKQLRGAHGGVRAPPGGRGPARDRLGVPRGWGRVRHDRHLRRHRHGEREHQLHRREVDPRGR